MKNKKSQISPWSFYGQIEDTDEQDEQQPLSTTVVEHAKTKIVKDHQSQNRKKIQYLNQLVIDKTKARQNITKNQNIRSYCPISSPSTASTLLRDQIIGIQQQNIIISAIKSLVQEECRDRQGKTLRKKYECLFPILKPKQNYHQMKLQRDRFLLKNPSNLKNLYDDTLTF